MSTALRRASTGAVIVLVALLTAVVTHLSSGSAAAGSSTSRSVSRVNVTVHLKHGTKHYKNVSSVRLYRSGHELKVTVRGGATHTFKKSFRSYLVTYVLGSAAATGTPTPTPTLPTGLPTTTPTGLPTTTPTGVPTGLPTGLPTTTPTGLPTLAAK
jgi:hypothetical protein